MHGLSIALRALILIVAILVTAICMLSALFGLLWGTFMLVLITVLPVIIGWGIYIAVRMGWINKLTRRGTVATASK